MSKPIIQTLDKAIDLIVKYIDEDFALQLLEQALCLIEEARRESKLCFANDPVDHAVNTDLITEE